MIFGKKPTPPGAVDGAAQGDGGLNIETGATAVFVDDRRSLSLIPVIDPEVCYLVDPWSMAAGATGHRETHAERSDRRAQCLARANPGRTFAVVRVVATYRADYAMDMTVEKDGPEAKAPSSPRDTGEPVR